MIFSPIFGVSYSFGFEYSLFDGDYYKNLEGVGFEGFFNGGSTLRLLTLRSESASDSCLLII